MDSKTTNRIYIPKICVNTTPEKSTTNKFRKESPSLRKSRQITRNSPGQSKSRSSSRCSRIISTSNADSISLDDCSDGNQTQNNTTIIVPLPKDWLLANAKCDCSKIIKMIKDDPDVSPQSAPY